MARRKGFAAAPRADASAAVQTNVRGRIATRPAAGSLEGSLVLEKWQGVERAGCQSISREFMR